MTELEVLQAILAETEATHETLQAIHGLLQVLGTAFHGGMVGLGVLVGWVTWREIRATFGGGFL
jgi:hypothetical protein